MAIFENITIYALKISMFIMIIGFGLTFTFTIYHAIRYFFKDTRLEDGSREDEGRKFIISAFTAVVFMLCYKMVA